VTKTLYAYLSRDLVRVALMALVVLTVLMTILGAIEPMRKQGLTGMQVLNLFGYLVPVVLPLTMPIAALFAATFVYGRFSQDNELLAAKASGIPPVVLLRPALILGVIVTVVSLGVSNYVAPVMAERLGKAVVDNLDGLAYQQLLSKECWKLGGRFIHADDVDRESGEIRGVVAAHVRGTDPYVVRLLVAPAARVWFDSDGETPYVEFDVSEVAATRSDRYEIAWLSRPTMDRYDLPPQAKEEPSWYNWDRLHATLKNPVLNSKIRGLLMEVHQGVCGRELSDRIARKINAGQPYEFSDGTNRYVLSAGGAEVDTQGAVRFSQGGRRVRLEVRGQGGAARIIRADSGDVSVAATPGGGSAVVIVLAGQVKVAAGGAAPVTQGEPWRLVVPAANTAEARVLVRRIAATIGAGGDCSFASGGRQYTLGAGGAERDARGNVKLTPIRRVTVAVIGETDKVVTGDVGKVTTAWSARHDTMVTSLTVGPGQVTVKTTRWQSGPLAVPDGFGSPAELGTHIAEALSARMPYSFSRGDAEYTVTAGAATAGPDGAIRLTSVDRPSGRRRVRIEYRRGTIPRTVEADTGEISIDWSPTVEARTIAITLSGNVAVERRKEWTPQRLLLVPDDINERVRTVDPAAVYRNTAAHASNKELVGRTRREIGYLHWEIVAEMHRRIALGLSGCLLVGLGAALGLVFRGGEVLSAFAISVAPAVVAYVVVIMGQELVTNPDVDPTMGLGVVWSGDILLLLANLYVFGRVMRR